MSQTIDGCESERAQILYLVKDTIVFDLGNDTTICEKESVTLNAPLATSYSWSTGANTQSIDVTTTGIYTIEISNEKGCKSSDSKEINIEGCIIDHFDEDTIYICKGESIQIEAKDITDEIWGGDEDFILLNQSTIQVSPDQDAYYFVGSEAGYTVGQNIIINGDFEQGGVGFTSDYTNGCSGVLNPGKYCVNSNPKSSHGGFSTCGDHTSGTGNMMVVNAATTAGVSVWCQTVTVEPATDYEFSGWITSVHPSNPAILEFKINGALMGSRLNATTTTCQWDQYAAQWNSGLNTSVEICLDNQNTFGQGNDFAIDDISFAPVIPNAIGGDSILVIVHDRPEVDLGGNSTICAGDSITLKTSLAGTYLWSNNSTQSFINVKESGNYSLEVTNAEGCKGDTTVNITIQELPIVNLGNDSTLCKGDEITISASNSGASYLWNTGDHSQTINITLDGEYKVVVTDNIGCSSSDSIELFFRDLPLVNLGNDTVICEFQSVILDAKNTGFSYSWNTGLTTQTIVVDQTGMYSVEVSDSIGCSRSDEVEVTVNPIPVVNLGNDTIICAGDSITLNAQNSGFNYKWNTGESSQSIVITSNGNYEVEVFDEIGCADTSAMTLKVNDLPLVNLGNDTVICEFQSVILDAKNTGFSYSWNTGLTTQTIVVDQTGMYSVEVSDSIGCSRSDEVEVTVNPIPVVNLGNDTIICAGESITLNAQNSGFNYKWNTGESSQSIVITSNGNYEVEVFDEIGCADTSAMTLKVNDLPLVNLGNDTVICEFQSVILDAKNTGFSYSWNTGLTTQTIVVDQTGMYSVEVSDSIGCSRNDEIYVNKEIIIDPYSKKKGLFVKEML